MSKPGKERSQPQIHVRIDQRMGEVPSLEYMDVSGMKTRGAGSRGSARQSRSVAPVR